MAVLFTWSSLWNEYPDYVNYPEPGQVKTLVGGAVNADWIVNTCAIRLSRALNYNGVPVPGNFPGLLTVKGADGKRYAIRVAEVRKWLAHALAKPEFDITKKRGDPFDKTPISAMKGIIGFDIHFSDATGHLDLWDGLAFSSEQHTSEDYWTPATRVSLWKTTA
jgi:Type VI secretion system (T6SS), amidase effector protein 4